MRTLGNLPESADAAGVSEGLLPPRIFFKKSPMIAVSSRAGRRVVMREVEGDDLRDWGDEARQIGAFACSNNPLTPVQIVGVTLISTQIVTLRRCGVFTMWLD